MMNFWKSIWTEVYVDFKPYGWEHLTVVLLFVAMGFGIFRKGQQAHWTGKIAIARAMAWTIVAFQIVWLSHKCWIGTFDLKENLPFHLCNVNSFLMPFAFYNIERRKPFFQVMYFFVMVGTIQGVLTPSLTYQFPYIGYLKYWAVHAGLVLIVLYGTIILRWRPTLRGVGYAIIAINLYAIVTSGVNWIFDSNYGYLASKPPTASLFDYFGEHYLMVTEVMMSALFFVAWLPFASKKVIETA